MTQAQTLARHTAISEYLKDQSEEGWQKFLGTILTDLGGFKYKIKDGDGDVENPREVTLTVSGGNQQLCIAPSGYGDKCTEDGFGEPILVELYSDELRVIVWADINQEDPTHTISLEDAREDRRKEH